ncbi:MAG TPA: biotin/lipoyl-containing protein, partial [Solirubrobacteraceae bacterium]
MATGTTAQQTVDVVTPAAGESVSEGTILEWRVKLGDFIKVDETIVEISTDKVDLELPSPASGTVSEILVEEGDTVTVGQVIARISLDGGAPTGATVDAAPTKDAVGQAPTTDGVERVASDGNGAVKAAAAEPADDGARGAAQGAQTIDVLTPAA